MKQHEINSTMGHSTDTVLKLPYDRLFTFASENNVEFMLAVTPIAPESYHLKTRLILFTYLQETGVIRQLALAMVRRLNLW